MKGEEKELLEAAAKAMNNAYVLWGFKVGAAVLAEDNKIYEGCNIESWISGLGTCAERCAIDHAVLHGNRRIKKIAVVMETDKVSAPKPCGACRQFIRDFSDPTTIVIMAKAKDGKVLEESVNVTTVKKLLPNPFP